MAERQLGGHGEGSFLSSSLAPPAWSHGSTSESLNFLRTGRRYTDHGYPTTDEVSITQRRSRFWDPGSGSSLGRDRRTPLNPWGIKRRHPIFRVETQTFESRHPIFRVETQTFDRRQIIFRVATQTFDRRQTISRVATQTFDRRQTIFRVATQTFKYQ